MAPDSIDATVQVDKKPRFRSRIRHLALFPTPSPSALQCEHLFLPGAVAATSREGPDETNEVVHCLRNYIRHRVRTMGLCQVQTIVPEVVSGAKPVTVEHIKIHGAALEGNLEGDAVDRDAIVFLPRAMRRIRSTIIGCLCAAWLFDWRRTMVARDSRPQTVEGHSRRGRRR